MKRVESFRYARLTGRIISICYEVYRSLGPGLREDVYVRALQAALAKMGISVYRERAFPLRYAGRQVGEVRVDLDVACTVVLEIKAQKTGLDGASARQIQASLRASGRAVGLLINFFGSKPAVRRFGSPRKKSDQKSQKPCHVFPPEDISDMWKAGGTTS
jgi:GxxExxY protein